MTTSTTDAMVRQYRDEQGRAFGYVPITHPGAHGLVVHFSAFFGRWGNAKAYRDQFQGYFHRLKMLGSCQHHDWLFLCDTYGAFENGTYYTGERGDFFVERAVRATLEPYIDQHGRENVVMMGSSMGATAALKFGLMSDVAGIVAISPHVDLDICALRQNRFDEVAFICPDGRPDSPSNFPYTRQITNLIEYRPTERALPRLFIQSCEDDAGVHDEQVVPLIDRWTKRGGEVFLDARATGGHTSDYATRPLLLHVADRLLSHQPIDINFVQTDARFRAVPTVPPMSHRLRRRIGLARRALLQRRR
jgi:hypothetical protein